MDRELQSMQKSLYDAAVGNDVSTLRDLLQKDPQILDKASLNCRDKNLLHVAAMFGNEEFVDAVLVHSPDLCFAEDRFGRIPLHFAVIKGRLPVLKKLIHASPISARERTQGGGNILHLCVKHNQLKALKFLLNTIKDGDFANRKDDEGMTILHLAICGKQTETIKFLLQENTIVDVNAKNANGRTALDLCGGDMNSEIAQTLNRAGAKRGEDISSFGAGNGGQEASHNIGAKGNDNGRTALDLYRGDMTSEIAQTLNLSGAKRGEDISSFGAGNGRQEASHNMAAKDSEWLYKKRDSLMVVASLIATMAFEAGLNPAGGVWQDDEPPHVAGAAVMAFKHPHYYRNFIRVNTVAFVSSLSTILFLISGLPFRNKWFCWALMVIMWLTISATALTYGISIVMVTPKAYGKSLSHVIKTAVTVWCGVMLLLLLGNTIRLINRWLKLRRCGDSAVQAQSTDQV